MLRGASAAELKAVKRVVWLAVNVAYNLRLEVSYLNDRRACLIPCPLFPLPPAAAPPTSAPESMSGSGVALPPPAGENAVSVTSNTTGIAPVGGQPAAVGVAAGGASDASGPNAVSSSATIALAGESPVDASGDAVGSRPAMQPLAGGRGAVAGVGAQAAASVLAPAGDQNAQGSSGVSAGAGVAAATGVLVSSSTAGHLGARAGEAAEVTRKQADAAAASPLLPCLAAGDKRPLLSSSLRVDYGNAPLVRGHHQGGVLRAGSAGRAAEKAPVTTLGTFGSEHFAFVNQNLITTAIWMSQGTQCCPADFTVFQYYTRQVSAVGALMFAFLLSWLSASWLSSSWLSSSWLPCGGTEV